MLCRCGFPECARKGAVDYSEGCSRMKASHIKEDSMSKETNRQKPQTKKKAQHTLKEKRQAKKEKAEGKPPK